MAMREEAGKLITAHAEKIGISQAAQDLDISRQALYDIKRRKYCPSLALVQRACEVWGLEFNFRGLKVKKTVIASQQKAIVPPAIQTKLFEALSQLQKGQLQVVQAKRIGRALEFTFKLRIGA